MKKKEAMIELTNEERKLLYEEAIKNTFTLSNISDVSKGIGFLFIIEYLIKKEKGINKLSNDDITFFILECLNDVLQINEQYEKSSPLEKSYYEILNYKNLTLKYYLQIYNQLINKIRELEDKEGMNLKNYKKIQKQIIDVYKKNTDVTNYFKKQTRNPDEGAEFMGIYKRRKVLRNAERYGLLK